MYVFGNSLVNDVFLLVIGVYYFLVGIDFFDLCLICQWVVVFEVLVIVCCLFYVFVGVKVLWWNYCTVVLLILILIFVLVMVYGVGIINMGVMYCWRL